LSFAITMFSWTVFSYTPFNPELGSKIDMGFTALWFLQVFIPCVVAEDFGFLKIYFYIHDDFALKSGIAVLRNSTRNKNELVVHS